MGEITPGGRAMMTTKEVEREYGIDLITAETIRAGLIEVTKRMKKSLQRGAFSGGITIGLDFGVSLHLVRPEGTEMVAVTEGCSHFAFSAPHMTNLVLDEWGLENLGPGDTLVVNDSWRGAIHFSDINFLRPVFWEGEIAFVLVDAGHVMDIGGGAPGGFNNKATSYFEEGIRIPPMLITSADKPVRSTINLLLENTRLPRNMLGDIRAFFGTLRVGEERLAHLLKRYGLQTVRAACRYTLDLAERRMRHAIEQVPDGRYQAEDWMDDDGLAEEPMKIKASAWKKGSSIEIDFSGSSRQALGASTTCWTDLNRVLIGSKMVLDPRHPMNAGAMRPFHVIAPSGSVVTGLPPTSQSVHPEVGYKVASVALDLFGQMLPERAIARENGTIGALMMGGIDMRPGHRGTPFGSGGSGSGSWGGTHANDGTSFTYSSLYNVSDAIIEFEERASPVLTRLRDLVMDAAAPGKYRSGYSGAVVVELLSAMAVATTLMDSGRFVREGLYGGGAGMTTYLFKAKKVEGNRLHLVNGIIPLADLVPLGGNFDEEGRPDPEHGEWCRGAEFKTLKITNYPLQPGEVVYVLSPTGGGYGNPLDRDPEMVRLDVWNERLSPEFAERGYGVVLDRETLAVDDKATADLRAEMREKQRRGEWKRPVGGFNPWPRTYEELLVSSAAGIGQGATRRHQVDR